MTNPQTKWPPCPLLSFTFLSHQPAYRRLKADDSFISLSLFAACHFTALSDGLVSRSPALHQHHSFVRQSADLLPPPPDRSAAVGTPERKSPEKAARLVVRRGLATAGRRAAGLFVPPPITRSVCSLHFHTPLATVA